MSRPPSARPKTSSGRAPTATRRTSVATNGDHDAVPPRTGAGCPASRSSRMEMSSSARPPTGNSNRPPTSAMSSSTRPMTGLARPPTSAIRPVTQQGLSGGRAVSRMGTASTRQVLDKSYFLGILRAKMGQLAAEIGRLEDVFERGQRDRHEMVAYEKRAQENAMELKDLQGRLVDLNVIIDRMHTNSDMVQIEMEAKRVREAGDELEASVQELFSERQLREKESEQSAAAIDEQKRLNQAIMAGMEPGLRERYEEKKAEAEELRAEAERLQAELTSLDDKKAQLDMELENSPLKKKAVQMHESLAALLAKEAVLQKELELKETPEQKKEKLIEQMKRNNEQTAVIEKQIEQTKEQIDLCHEELNDFENDDSQFVRNNEKYRDLAMKDTDYTTFLDGYAENKRMLLMEMEEYSAAIVQNLQKISINLGKVSIEQNITDMDPVGITGNALHEKATPKELQDLHVRLQEELITLDEMEAKLRSERESLTKRTDELERQREEVTDLDGLSVQVQGQMEELEIRRDELSSVVPEREQRHDELDEKLRDIKDRLDGDPNYVAQKSLMTRLEILRESNAKLKTAAEARYNDTNYEIIKSEVTAMRLEYNMHLVQLGNGGRR